MRREDWAERLAEEIKAARSRPFVWGEHDCMLFVSDCVKAMTDEDPASDLRGKYDTEFGALRIISELGHESLAEAVTNRFRCVAIMRAKRGDILMYQGGLGICTGEHGAFLLRDGGLSFQPVLHCQAAWGVD